MKQQADPGSIHTHASPEDQRIRWHRTESEHNSEDWSRADYEMAWDSAERTGIFVTPKTLTLRLGRKPVDDRERERELLALLDDDVTEPVTISAAHHTEGETSPDLHRDVSVLEALNSESNEEPGVDTGTPEHIPGLSRPELYSPELRLTFEAFKFFRSIQERKQQMRRFSSRVTKLSWEELTGSSVKNLPFLYKAIFKSLKATAIKRREIREKSHPETTQDGDAREIFLPELWARRESLPVLIPGRLSHWNKLPATEKQSTDVRELVIGSRFASVVFNGAARPEDWLGRLPDMDAVFFTLDLNGEEGTRFLEAQESDSGPASLRNFLRCLQRDLKNTTMASVWTRPAGASDGTVRLFVAIRSTDGKSGYEMAELDQGLRFARNLKRHNVPVSIDGPLAVTDEHLTAYLGDHPSSPRFHDWTNVYEYSPETGIPSREEINRRWEKSRGYWARYCAWQGFPQFFGPALVERLWDSFILEPKEVQHRKRQTALLDRRGVSLAQKRRIIKSLATEALLVPGASRLTIYRASPAQFAALACRSGEVLGEHCTKELKSGPSKRLFEELRAAFSGTSNTESTE